MATRDININKRKEDTYELGQRELIQSQRLLNLIYSSTLSGGSENEIVGVVELASVSIHRSFGKKNNTSSN